ncbi:hypothetical protein U1Q18_014281 [Sarracenia purpurea var. burkii]
MMRAWMRRVSRTDFDRRHEFSSLAKGDESRRKRNPELTKLWINSLSRNSDPLLTSAAQREGLLDTKESRMARFTGEVLLSRKTRDARFTGEVNPELTKLWINSLSRNSDPLLTSAAQREGLLDTKESRMARFTERLARGLEHWKTSDPDGAAVMEGCRYRATAMTGTTIGPTRVFSKILDTTVVDVRRPLLVARKPPRIRPPPTEKDAKKMRSGLEAHIVTQGSRPKVAVEGLTRVSRSLSLHREGRPQDPKTLSTPTPTRLVGSLCNSSSLTRQPDRRDRSRRSVLRGSAKAAQKKAAWQKELYAWTGPSKA